jgi:hypothetical protein
MVRSREIYSALLAGKRPEAENRPAAHSREKHSALPAGKRPEAEKQSTGPLALQAATWPWAGKASSRLG